MSTYKHYLRGDLVGEYPMPEPGPVNAQDWGDPNPNFPLCSVKMDYQLDPPTPHTVAPWHARARVLFRWNVMDRLRYWGLWPLRESIRGEGETTPSGTIWEDLRHWVRTAGVCRVRGHEPERWFYDSYRQRFRCARCKKYDP